ncbi:histidine phosphatase family protein [Kluyveromyces lactis]|uniref:acid phosphatase n=1 Tax=Kluyveromyces lactis (strain ATCC 8585 / CBS 2359 / DSM 70799 / NBRC 1267 / NRRL Y-1140 / WM37) TaxID=284590 RepID=B5FV69_KLULA|nr:uncharacterized protein KLLA0_D00258g [Kluyveromyces lactis]CAR64370.1 KLLA0D00258p [Kluyveromyces lactis]|eukprot:XP_002999366.1 uncharacterized protein KLLA0_D00258g [Kluyveromyces lactis]
MKQIKNAGSNKLRLIMLSILLGLLSLSGTHAAPISKDNGTVCYALNNSTTDESIFSLLNGQGPHYDYPQSFGIPVEVPDQCTVEHVQMLARHGERYPTASKGKLMIALWDKLKEFQGQYNDPLEVFNDYEFFVSNTKYFDQLTNSTDVDPSNPYAGAKTAQHLGKYIAYNYGDLFSDSNPVFTSSSGRVHQTAKYVVSSLEEELDIQLDLQIIQENETSGANSLTPADSCMTYNGDLGDEYFENATLPYLTDIKNRWMKKNSNLNLTLEHDDIELLVDWCAFETNVKGSSAVCDLFERNDLVAYSYYANVNNFYRRGAGNPMSNPIGSVLVNASYNLLTQADELDNKVWLSFSHDTDIQQFISALGLIDNGVTEYSLDQVDFQNIQQLSWVTPMGGRIFTEKLKCGNASYVRYIINDVIIPVPGCTSGPGFSCPIEDFDDYITNRLNGIDYVSSCEVQQVSNTTELTFYWDYNEVEYNGPVSNK